MSSVCPNCLSAVPEGRRYCPSCGERLFKKRRFHIFAILLPAAVAAVLLLILRPAPETPPTPRERFTAANEAAINPALEVLRGGSCAGRAVFTADMPENPIAAVLRLSAVTVDYAAEDGALTAAVSLRVLGSPVLSGAVTFSDGLVGVYVPELDENYYRFNLSALVDLPPAETVAQYADLLLSLVTDEDLEVSRGEEGEEIFTCRLPEAADLDLTWTLTQAEGETRKIELALPEAGAALEFSGEDGFSLSLNVQDLALKASVDTSFLPQDLQEVPSEGSVFVPDSEVFTLINKLAGGVLDVL